MSKSIRSFPVGQRKAVADKRVAQKSGGLGYLAAQDALNQEIRKQIVKNLPVPVTVEVK